MRIRIDFVFLFLSMFVLFSMNATADDYAYIDPDSIQEIYEVYDQMAGLGDEYMPVNEWNNPQLEKACLENLAETYSTGKNANAKIKVIKVFLIFPKWQSYTKVSSDENNGIPTYRKTFCAYILQKDSDKYMVVWSNQVIEDCTNYDKSTLKPISWGSPRVTTPSATDWEDWGKVTAFKLTKQQASASAGKREKPKVSLEYYPGTVLEARIQVKSENTYLFLWETGEYSCFSQAEFEKAQNSVPSPDKLKAGTRVSAQWTNGTYYDGTILKIMGKAYTIKWDDGSDPIDVAIDQIRLLE